MNRAFLRLWLLRLILSLPPAILRFFSGSGVVYANERTLDPQFQFLWRSWFQTASGRVGLSLSDKSLEAARKDWQDAANLFGVPRQLRVKFENIGGDGGNSALGLAPVGGLLIRPGQIAPDAPVLVFFHQGGGVLGGPELSKAFCALLAQEARCPVFIPEYRLAPAHRFPAALDDARLVYDWVQAHALRFGAKSGQVAVGGVLAGAGLAARLCLDLKRDFKPLPVGQLLITPMLDLSDASIKAQGNAGLWPLTANDLDIMIGHYAGAADLTDPRLSPGLEKLIIGQPRTFIVSAGHDPLAGQAEAFAKRLIQARTQALYRRYDTLPLGFDLFAGVADPAREATIDIAHIWLDLLRAGKVNAEDDSREQSVA